MILLVILNVIFNFPFQLEVVVAKLPTRLGQVVELPFVQIRITPQNVDVDGVATFPSHCPLGINLHVVIAHNQIYNRVKRFDNLGFCIVHKIHFLKNF